MAGMSQQLDPAIAGALKRTPDGLIAAVVQDATSGAVLMQAWMDDAALARTLATREATYWSRSRGEQWIKGATSGHVQKVHEILVDCDQDALVLKVEQIGPGCCHNGYRSCFYRRVPPAAAGSPFPLQQVADPTYDPDAVYGKK